MDDKTNYDASLLSKEGLAVAMAKLSTDMEWVKEMLTQLSRKIDENNDSVARMIGEIKSEHDEKFKDHEERIRRLERDRNRLWGAISVLGAIITLIEYLIQALK